MYKNIRDTLIILTGIQIILVASEETSINQINFHYCSNNFSAGPDFVKKEMEANFTCQCHGGLLEKEYSSKGYTYTPGVGFHKLHTTARTWNQARKICNEEKGHLAIINSKLEESVLVGMLKKAANEISTDTHCKKTAFLGIHDMYQEGEWVTVLDEPLSSTGYSSWSPNYFSKPQPDNANGNQNCGTLLTKTGMDDDFCCRKYAFFCELPLMKYEFVV